MKVFILVLHLHSISFKLIDCYDSKKSSSGQHDGWLQNFRFRFMSSISIVLIHYYLIVDVNIDLAEISLIEHINLCSA